MGEYRDRMEKEQKSDLEKIDLMNYVQDICHGVKRLWWLFLILIAFFAVQSYFSVRMTYQPQYVASATVSVSGVGGGAEEMAEVFPYILDSGVLKDIVAEDMGMETMPGTIDVKATEGLNLLTISVNADDPQVAYATLMSVIKNYPEVAEFVLGQTTLTILDETGIPSDTERAQVIRGSYKRGALKGGIISLVILIIYVVSRRTVKSSKELKRHVNLSECGVMPHVRNKKRKKESFHSAVSLLNDRLPQSYREAIRKLRTRVIRELEQNGDQALLMSSSIPGEGKTTLAANLAIAIAQQGKKVILVDCDVRNPSVAAALNLQGEQPGLVKLLEQKATMKDAMQEIVLPGDRSYGEGSLQVICGGEPQRDGTAILGSESMRALINMLKKRFDIVILDTAPSELLADAPVLAKYADAALYVVRYDYTKLRQIREGVQTLAMSGVHMIGYVFNDDHSSKAKGYGYGYGYGYGRYSRYGGYRSSRYRNRIQGPEGEETDEKMV